MRFGLVFSVLSTVACQESGVKVVNAAPEAYITSHATGDSVREGDTETLLGQVSDTDHALSELTAAGCTTVSRCVPTRRPMKPERSAAM